MNAHDVVIAGGGPTGLMLAAELRLAGVDAVIVERRATQDLDGSRAGGLHPRTLEVLDQRGVVDRFVDAGQKHPAAGFAGIFLDISDFPTRHNYLLGLWQRDIERILAGWVLDELGAPIMRRRDVRGFVQDDDGVTVTLDDGDAVRATYLVGCDGGRSVVRKTAGIDFVGYDATATFLICEAEMTDPEVGMRREGGGLGPANPGVDDGRYRFALKEDAVSHDGEPTFEDAHALLVAKYGTDFGLRNPTWISRFGDATRQAATYRSGRVFVAGDAAHIHGPQGGQGLNVGVQDAVNLGWKLGQVLRGAAPDALLDTYHAERHPVAARVLHNTMAQVALSIADERHDAMRDITIELLAMDEPRRYVAGMVTGLDVFYDLGGDHPLVGRRMPDLDLRNDRVYERLHAAQPVELDLAAQCTATTCELPVIGRVPLPQAVMIRPDGYVAAVTLP
ncbi:MAG TPA: FAD-dependent monooxygenase [Acidimicrobiales bacterium]|nr:FAD-dependent monooxygenase [Acidimicrobiales bacterium]